MFAVTRPFRLKSTDPNFFCENLQKITEDLLSQVAKNLFCKMFFSALKN